MTSFSVFRGGQHHQNGSSVPVGQVRQNGPSHIVKSVELHRQNGSTVLVSFYESHTKVSLEALGLCSGYPQPSDVGVGAGQIGGAA